MFKLNSDEKTAMSITVSTASYRFYQLKSHIYIFTDTAIILSLYDMTWQAVLAGMLNKTGP